MAKACAQERIDDALRVVGASKPHISMWCGTWLCWQEGGGGFSGKSMRDAYAQWVRYQLRPRGKKETVTKAVNRALSQ